MSEMDSSFYFQLRSTAEVHGNVLQDSLTRSIYPLDEVGRAIVNVCRSPLEVDAAAFVHKVMSMLPCKPTHVERELRQ